MGATTDFRHTLRTLLEHEVDFIVVGGVGALLHGAPVATFDLDLVHDRAPANVDRLLRALAVLEGRYRARPDHRPDRSHLESPGHQLLLTRSGPLDLLGSVVGGQGYRDLLPRTVAMEIAPGLAVRVLELAALIEIKERLGRDKDRAVLPVLRRTLEEQKGRDGRS